MWQFAHLKLAQPLYAWLKPAACAKRLPARTYSNGYKVRLFNSPLPGLAQENSSGRRNGFGSRRLSDSAGSEIALRGLTDRGFVTDHGTMQQIRRLGVAIVSLGLVVLGVMMLVAPGPEWLAVLLGLGVLAAEFLWACWLRKGAELVDSAFGRGDISKLAASRERERTWQKPSRRQRRHTSLTVFLGHSAIPDLGP
jgi:hypothetical protein